MQGGWRLVGGRELYNIKDDPGQARDVAAKYPERLASLDEAYRKWHTEAHAEFLKTRYIDLGHPDAPSTILYASDWEGGYCDNPGGLQASTAKGVWHVDVVRAGLYAIELSRWPFESGKTLAEGTDPKGTHPQRGLRPITAANLQIAGANYTLDADPGAKCVTFCVRLKVGKARLQTYFLDENGRALCSANYTRVTRLESADVSLTPTSDRKPEGDAPTVRTKKTKAAAASATPVKLGPGDLLIADFEGETYGDWAVEGTAFGSGPARGMRVTSYQGQGIVDTYLTGGGDKLTGKLSSPRFMIQRQRINLMIGGGHHAGTTCVNLLVNGKVVHSAAGSASKDNRGKKIMRWVSWNVTAFKGQDAQIQIVDNATGGWGHIVVDHIFLSDRAVGIRSERR